MEFEQDWYPISLQPPHEFRGSFFAEEKIKPDPDYLENAWAKDFRSVALNAIEAYYKCDDDDFDAFIPYLAMNYFDRVISKHKYVIICLNDDQKRTNDLFVICCLTLAWKRRTRCIEHPYFLENLQEEYTYIEFMIMEDFYIKETLVDYQRSRVGVRTWTPFSFAEYFISIFHLTGDQLSSTRKLVHQNIVTSQADMRITTIRPSLVAASAVYVVSKKLLPKQSSSMLQEEILTWDNITKQELSSCNKTLQPICNAMVENLKSSSAKEDAKAETSSSGLGGTGQSAGASCSSQPKPAQASVGTDDLKLDFELGWSKYDELIRATSTPVAAGFSRG